MNVHHDLAEAFGSEFELLRPLGTGTMGSVHLAREVALRRLVAIKVPRAELARDEAVRARFEREGRAAARVKHRSAVDVHRIGHLPDGTPFLVMEYVEGRTLADVIRGDGPLPEPIALRVLAQLAEALAEAHAHAVIHRDVRPGNVILSPDGGRAVLTDFGIAGILETGSESVTRLTRTGERLGDPAHMSPEQLRGDPVTGAADVFGLGVLGYEILTGQHPFRGESPHEIAAAHLRQAPRALRELKEDADPDLARLLERCLAREPAQRPSAHAIIREIGRIDARRALAPGTGNGDAVSRAAESFPALAGFFRELKRRRVYNAALLYVAGALVLLQAADQILPVTPLPEWVYTAIVAVTLAGFPVAVVLAWLYDFTSSGIRRTGSDAAPGMSRAARLLLPFIALLVSIALSIVIARWMLP